MSLIMNYVKEHWIPIVSVLLVALIVTLLVVQYKKSSENFKQCVCSSRQGGCKENCQDVEVVEDAYASGAATEFTDFKSPGWNRGPSPGSYRFPASCSGAPYAEHPNFGPWDFTEFGNR